MSVMIFETGKTLNIICECFINQRHTHLVMSRVPVIGEYCRAISTIVYCYILGEILVNECLCAVYNYKGVSMGPVFVLTITALTATQFE